MIALVQGMVIVNIHYELLVAVVAAGTVYIAFRLTQILALRLSAFFLKRNI